MKRVAISLIAIVFACGVASFSYAQEAAAAVQEKEIRASYEDFVEWGNRLEGQWVGKITLIADWPGLGKKQGDEVTGRVAYKWSVDKQAIEELSFVAEGSAKCLHFWDAGSHQIKIVCVTSGGGTWTARLGRDGDKWPWKLKGYLKDGTSNEGSGVDTLTADGALIVQGDCTLGGEKLLPLRDVYTKVSGSVETREAGKAKERFKELGDKFVGQWVLEDTLPVDVDKIGKAGDVLIENKTVIWVSDGTALLEKRIYRCNGKTVLEGVALTAWDGLHGQIRSAYFDSLGGTYRFNWRKKKDSWVLRFSGVFGDGLKNSGVSTMTFSADGNTISLHDTDLVYGPHELDDREAEFRRVKE